jgi:hypothetical protein
MQNTTTLARIRFLSMKGIRAAVPQREVGNGNSKVNDRAIRVKPVRCGASEGNWKTAKGHYRQNKIYLPCVEATLVLLVFLELLLAATVGLVPGFFFCATLFCGATALPWAIFFLLKSFTIRATYARVS